MKYLITGGAGFVGSTTARHLRDRHDVRVLDNLSRPGVERNAENLKREGIEFYKGDIRNPEDVIEASRDADVIIHTAAQTAVTTSLEKPREDFEINARGTFNVMEAARENNTGVIFCSTNKVYGDNVNDVPLQEKESRYEFAGELQETGIPEDFPIDADHRSPYGVSKTAGELYVRDYAETFNVPTATNRMSCIYGTNQFGTEDQGWLSHFTISAVTGEPLTIFGDGKQVRDILWGEDLARLFERESENLERISPAVYNVGGGYDNTVSLLELLDILEEEGSTTDVSFDDWRPADQKAYYSDISRAEDELGWDPQVGKREGIKRIHDWVREHKDYWV